MPRGRERRSDARLSANDDPARPIVSDLAEHRGVGSQKGRSIRRVRTESSVRRWRSSRLRCTRDGQQSATPKWSRIPSRRSRKNPYRNPGPFAFPTPRDGKVVERGPYRAEGPPMPVAGLREIQVAPHQRATRSGGRFERSGNDDLFVARRLREPANFISHLERCARCPTGAFKGRRP